MRTMKAYLIKVKWSFVNNNNLKMIGLLHMNKLQPGNNKNYFKICFTFPHHLKFQNTITTTIQWTHKLSIRNSFILWRLYSQYKAEIRGLIQPYLNIKFNNQTWFIPLDKTTMKLLRQCEPLRHNQQSTEDVLK